MRPQLLEPFEYNSNGRGNCRNDLSTGLIHRVIDEKNRVHSSIDEEVTVVILGLPFKNDRAFMSENMHMAFASVHPNIKIKNIFPVGHSCSHCFVVFEYAPSRDVALKMRMVSLFERFVNIYPSSTCCR